MTCTLVVREHGPAREGHVSVGGTVADVLAEFHESDFERVGTKRGLYRRGGLVGSGQIHHFSVLQGGGVVLWPVWALVEALVVAISWARGVRGKPDHEPQTNEGSHDEQKK